MDHKNAENNQGTNAVPAKTSDFKAGLDAKLKARFGGVVKVGGGSTVRRPKSDKGI